MRVLVQRVSEAGVTVDGHVAGEIGPGLLLFVGIAEGDGEQELVRMATKVLHLRIFEDTEGRMNRSILDVHDDDASLAGMLVVSQFTLYADVAKGRRPSFVRAAPPVHAAALIEQFVAQLKGSGVRVAEGLDVLDGSQLRHVCRAGAPKHL